MLSSHLLPNLTASLLPLQHESYKTVQISIEKAVETPFRSLLLASLPFVATWVLWTIYLDRKLIPGFPLVGQAGSWDFLRIIARYRYMIRSDRVVREGQEQLGEDTIFQVTGHSAPYLVVPMKYMNELRNHEDLSMSNALIQDFFGDYKPFHATAAAMKDDLVVQTIQKKLNIMLTMVTDPVNEENNIAIPKYWPATKDGEWKEHLFMKQIQLLVCQVTSRVFLGASLCRDEKWIEIAKSYTIDLVIASFSMQFIPRQIRPLVWRLLPPVHKLRRTGIEARKIILPEIDRRRADAAAALARGEKLPKHLDAIDWMIELTAGDPNSDIVSGQLILIFAAIHTTSTTLAHLLYDIIENDLTAELREEIVSIYREDGAWTKSTFQKLKLLDSVMKESQRLNTLTAVTIHRYAAKDVTLSNGALIPGGTRFLTPNFNQTSEKYYENAKQFDGKRFLRLREQPGNINKYQYVTPTPEHTSFGIGNHSCPGRFFASNEIKLIMAHLLLKFDWKFVNDKRPPKGPTFGGANTVDEIVPILYRSRVPEIYL